MPLTNTTTSGLPVLVLDDRELVNRQPVVVRRVLEVDEPYGLGADVAVSIAVLDRHALDKQLPDAKVLGDRVLRLSALQALDRLIDEIGMVRVEPASRPRAAGRRDRSARTTRRSGLGPSEAILRAELGCVAKIAQVLERRILYD